MQKNFKPKPIVRNSFVQTVLSSLRMTPPENEMTRAAGEIILDGANGEKLLAYHSRQKGDSKGTVLLIHGWEGSSSSTYIINTGGIPLQPWIRYHTPEPEGPRREPSPEQRPFQVHPS